MLPRFGVAVHQSRLWPAPVCAQVHPLGPGSAKTRAPSVAGLEFGNAGQEGDLPLALPADFRRETRPIQAQRVSRCCWIGRVVQFA